MVRAADAGRNGSSLTPGDNHDDAIVTIQADYPDPLWVQAVNLVRGQLDRGILRPGMRLPPERRLCEQLGISRVTLRKALGQLVEEGVLSSSHGRGWYVSDLSERQEWPNRLESFSETAARMGLTAGSRVLRAAESAASLDEAEQLAVAPGTALFYLRRIRLLDRVPIAVEDTTIPSASVPGIGSFDFTDASLYQVLRSAGLEPARADSTIEAREADVETAGHLGLDVGKPVLVLHQVVVDDDERPVFVSTMRYAGDRYRLRTSLARR